MTTKRLVELASAKDNDIKIEGYILQALHQFEHKRVIYIQDRVVPEEVVKRLSACLELFSGFEDADLQRLDIVYLDEATTPGVITDSEQLINGYSVDFSLYNTLVINTTGKFTKVALTALTAFCESRGIDVYFHTGCYEKD